MQSQKNTNTIFLNPKFKNIHINPNFLLKQNSKPNNIHVNPLFMNHLNSATSNLPDNCDVVENNDIDDNEKLLIQQVISSPSTSTVVDHSPHKSDSVMIKKLPIISKTNRKLVRIASSVPFVSRLDSPISPRPHLIKIGKNKLIRSSGINPAAPKSISIIPKKLVKTGKTKINVSTYKIDRRSTTRPTVLINKKNKYALHNNQFAIMRRFDNVLTPKKVVITDRKLMRIGTQKTLLSQPIQSKNKKLVMLNINGVLYKSTNTKLQKSTTAAAMHTTPAILPNKPGERILFIRGEKFVLNPDATKLKRFNKNNTAKLNRIDIGGITYVAKSNTSDTYLRTGSHLARTHLNNAKQKSISLLSNKMIKNNVPCPIYRRLGKCLSFQRGKCQKVHNPEHVIICPKFLKGACDKDQCLLSHNVSLSKMPTCKFFLQGCCAKTDCPYLHKKLNDREEICREFLKGFCSLASKCTKRHEFLCPEFESNGKCDRIRCPHPHREKNTKSKKPKKRKAPVPAVEEQEMDVDIKLVSSRSDNIRYYSKEQKTDEEKTNELKTVSPENKSSDVCDNPESAMIAKSAKRPKLGELPSYIPLE